jgi:hypothetical protein
MLGQQAMKLLSEKHVSDVTKPKVLKPDWCLQYLKD